MKNIPLSRFIEFKMMLILAVTGVFDYYYLGLISFALPQIQSQFSLSEREITGLVGSLRLAFIPSVFFAVTADFIGRKPFILFCTLMLIICSVSTALAESVTYFFVFQFLSFLFISAETSVAIVMIVEEVKKNIRAFAVALLSGLSAVGTGLAAVVYGINAHLELRFQHSYYYGILPLVIILLLRTKLKETELFTKTNAQHPTQRFREKIIDKLTLLHNESFLLLVVCIAVLCHDICVAPAYILASKYLQETHSLKPDSVSLLVILAGSIATIGSILVGYISDVVGRKKTLYILMTLTVFSVITFYNSNGASLYVSWFLFILASSSSSSILTTIGSEIFPTQTRASVVGIRGMFSAVGGAIGLLIAGELTIFFRTYGISMTALTVMMFASMIIIYKKIPETFKRSIVNT